MQLNWYTDERFHRFWHYYNAMMLTSHKNAIAHANESERYLHEAGLSLAGLPSSGILNPFEKCDAAQNIRSKKRHRSLSKQRSRNRRNRIRHRKKMQSQKASYLSDTEILHTQMKERMHIEDESDDDTNLDSDYLKFLEESEKHKMEWKVRKRQQVPDSEEELLDDLAKEHPDVIRSREMHQLYGSSSPRVHAMETAMQLSYDRISTRHQPGYWPNIPLKVMF